MAGNWSLSVQNGQVSNLTAKFIMVHTDGTERHIHEFKNFKSSTSTPIVLSSHTPIMGTVDITKNGQDMFKGVSLVVMVENRTVASMAVDSHATQSHFGGQPIYVVLTSFKDKNGVEQLQTPSTSTSSTSITQTASNGLSSAINSTSSFFSNASKSLSGMFNQTKK
jgi:hypothetical protein